MQDNTELSKVIETSPHHVEDVEALYDVLSLFTAPPLQGPNRPNPREEEQSVSSWFVSMLDRLKEVDESFRFNRSTGTLLVVPRLMLLLKDCLASQRWKEVLDILRVMALECKNTSVTLWKVGFELMMSDKEANNGLLLQLVNQLKFLCDIEAKEITLEYLKHFLCQGKIQDTIQVLQSSQTGGKQRGVRLVTERTEQSEAMLKAYQGLVWYVEWLQAKHRLNYLEEQAHEDFYQSSSSSMLNQEEIMKVHADKALTAFESLNNTPGVLDVFIMKQATLLEYYNRMDEAKVVLRQYAEKNPDNPNAHRYLYWFLQRTEADAGELCPALQTYVTVVPSDALALKLCKLQHSMGRRPSHGLPHLFGFLDYPSGKGNFEAWECLHQTLVNIFSKCDRDDLALVKKCWDIRSSWWPSYQFVLPSLLQQPDADMRTVKDVLLYKAAVAVFLLGTDNDFSSMVAELLGGQAVSLIHEAKTLMEKNDVT